MTAASRASGVQLDARIVIPERGVDVRLSVSAGQTCALIGPNGAGKSTVLSSMAGIGPRGDVDVRLHADAHATTWADATSGQSIPAHARDCGYLTQNPLLFPHLSCLDNVAYGLRARHHLNRRSARAGASDALQLVGMDAFATRMPHELSGGQAARVALARALAPRPSVMLLDEPFAALDIDAAHDMRQLCAELLDATTTLIATHNVRDVRALADTVAVIESGHVAEWGSAARILDVPTSSFTHRFVASH